jgi:SAM-dependent methyltransferase
MEPATSVPPGSGVPQLDRDRIALKAQLEEKHWWYRGRRAVLSAACRRLPIDAPGEVLDVGCGIGRNLDWLGGYGRTRGIELNPAAVAWARSQGRTQVDVGDAQALPYEDGRFGLVTCLDVLEHLPDDGMALAELRRVTRRDGTLVLTVPAYPRLFSTADEQAGHQRRYSARPLTELARSRGWEVLLRTHFNLILLPPAAIARLAARRRKSHSQPRSDLLATPATLNGPLSVPMRIEAAAIGAGARLPAGLSLLLGLRAR